MEAMEAGGQRPIEGNDAASEGEKDFVDGFLVDEMEEKEQGEAPDLDGALKLPTAQEDREEGELEEDMAQTIRENDMKEEHPVTKKEESREEDEEDGDVGETMEDSEPLYSSGEEDSSSSSSSDDDDDEDINWAAPLEQQLGGDQRRGHNDSSDEEEDKPPKTKNEISTLPPVAKVDVQLQPHHRLISIGTISSVVEAMIIIEGDENHQALDEGSILWLADNRLPLGYIDEVFGPVKKPFYVVRLNEAAEIPEGARVSAPVAFVPDFATTVLKDDNLFKKGYDASGQHDEELSEDDVEFSDDEKEAEFKREKARAKRTMRGDSNSQPSRERKPPRNTSKFRNGAPRKVDHRRPDLSSSPTGFSDEQENELRRLIYESQKKSFPLFGGTDVDGSLGQQQQPTFNHSRSQPHENGNFASNVPEGMKNTVSVLSNTTQASQLGDFQNPNWHQNQQQSSPSYHHFPPHVPEDVAAMGYQPSPTLPPFWPGQPSVPYPTMPTSFQYMPQGFCFEARAPPQSIYQQAGNQYFGGYPNLPVGYMPVPGLGWWQTGPPVSQTPPPPQVMDDTNQDGHSA